MKLLYCTSCSDVVGLTYPKERSCHCGACKGAYSNPVDAWFTGPGVMIGFANNSFLHAVKNQPEEGQGYEFVAFVIPKKCDSVIKKD